MTPVQIYRNVRDLRNPPDPLRPSDRFAALVWERIAERLLAEMALPSGK